MRLTPPKKNTFWASIVIAVVGFVLYALTYAKVLSLEWLGLLGVLLLVVGFILLSLGLTTKGL